MMMLKENIRRVFSQLSESLEQIHPDQYNYSCSNLSGNSIGKHVRHIIEMYQCLQLGYASGEIDYEKRKRDQRIETDKQLAGALLSEILLHLHSENKNLFLLVYGGHPHAEPERISTNYFREIAYNLEHTVHHMALIRVGLKEIGNVPVADSYGVAESTLKYRQQCVQ